MAWGRRKIELKVSRKPAFPAHFSCNRSFLCLLSPPWLSATTIFITRLLSIIPTSSSHQTISRGGCTTSLSLSSVKIFFPATVTSLNSSNSRSSGQHLAQKPFSFPKTARVAALSPATPTTPTASFPSPSQASIFFLFQRWPEPATGLTTTATPCTIGQDASSLNAR